MFPRKFWPLVGCFAIFAFGGCVGHSTAPPPKERVVTHTVTKTVTVPADTPDPVTKYVMPDSCHAALLSADTIRRKAEAMYAASDEQLNILRDARESIAGGGDLVKIDERQRAFQGRVIGNLSDLEKALYLYTLTRHRCERAEP